MAAHTNNFIRVRLHFDYPSPAVVDTRRCWLLVDLSACRVVADLESVIREKFEFGRGSILSLFVEDCYLPHTESALVVRDNDNVRVKVDCRDQPNALGCEDAPAESCRKRARPAEESGPGENGVSKKKKKKKKRAEESVETGQASGDERSETTQQKKKKKKKRKKEEEEPAAPKAAASPKKPTVKIPQKPPALKSKPQKAPSSDSSSEEDEAPKGPAAPTMPSSKAPPTSKPTQTKARPPPSPSSSETSGDEAAVVKTTAAGGGGASAPDLKSAKGSAQRRAASGAAAAPPGRQSESSDSEEEIRLVIRRPAQPPGLVAGGDGGGGGGGGSLPWRGRGRGQGGRGGRGEDMGRGAGRGGIRGRGVGSGGRGIGGGVGGVGGGVGGAAFGFNYDRAAEPSCRTDQLTNMSVVLQSGAADAPPRDYSAMPLLAAPPQVGQKIAFKLLELTENYTPEVSEYKEGKIVSFDLTTKQIELLVLNNSRAPVEPGKFDLVYQNADGSESVEYAVSRGSRVTERWDSLLEPRLVL